MAIILKRQFLLKDSQNWDDYVLGGTEDFFKEFSVHPNVLLASARTWEKINKSIQIGDNQGEDDEESFDKLFAELQEAAKKNPKNDNPEDLQNWKNKLIAALEGSPSREKTETEENRYINFDEESGIVNAFYTDDFHIDFCEDNEVADDTFVLVYDEDPHFDGEPVEHNYKKVA